MKIKIEKIDRSDVVVLSDRCRGYRGEFSCPMVRGWAILVPYSGGEEALAAGNHISVETGQQSISEFRILESSGTPTVSPLPSPGDYSVVGQVELDGGGQVFDVDVGGLLFTLDIEDTGGKVPRIGTWVSFHLHGLSLWDENT